MGTSSFSILFLFSLLTGGASDLLDVVPADEYWRAKNVQVTEALIRDELAPPPPIGDISKLIDGLGDDVAANRDAAADKIRAMGPAVAPQLLEAARGGNPEVAARAKRLATEVRAGGSNAAQVRRLMALRTAGERRMAALLPRLKELAAAAPEPFVADYAAAAVAAIEGKPFSRPRADPGANDAWLLPAATRAIVHLGVAGAARPATAEDLARAVKSAAAGPGVNRPADPKEAEAQVAREARAMLGQVIAVAERVGNVRVDGVTVGVSGEVGPNAGYVTFIVRGQYDAKAVGDYAAEVMGGPGGAGVGVPAGPGAAPGAAAAKREAVAGVDVLRPGPTAALLLADNTRAAFVAGPGPQQLPVEELAKLLKAGRPGPLKDVPEMAKLVGQLDVSLPVWAAVHVTDGYRQLPLFRALTHLVMTGRAKGEGVAFRIDAAGQNGPAVADAVTMVNQSVGMAKSAIKPMVDAVPDPEMRRMAKIGLDLLDSIKCAPDAADPTKASLTGELSTPPASLLMGAFGMFGFARSEVAPAPPPPAQPAPAPPARP